MHLVALGAHPIKKSLHAIPGSGFVCFLGIALAAGIAVDDPFLVLGIQLIKRRRQRDTLMLGTTLQILLRFIKDRAAECLHETTANAQRPIWHCAI